MNIVYVYAKQNIKLNYPIFFLIKKERNKNICKLFFLENWTNETYISMLFFKQKTVWM